MEIFLILHLQNAGNAGDFFKKQASSGSAIEKDRLPHDGNCAAGTDTIPNCPYTRLDFERRIIFYGLRVK